MSHGVVGEPISRLPFGKILENQDIGYSRLGARTIEIRRARDQRSQTAGLHLFEESRCNLRTDLSLLATRIEGGCLSHRASDFTIHVNVVEEDKLRSAPLACLDRVLHDSRPLFSPYGDVVFEPGQEISDR